MQRNTKGLLCSLLFRLLVESIQAIGVVLLALLSVSLKSSDTDWSVSELLSTCLRVMRNDSGPICMFSDDLGKFPDANAGVAEL